MTWSVVDAGSSTAGSLSLNLPEGEALLHFHTPRIITDGSSWKNVAESFAVALTLTLGGYKSANPLAPDLPVMKDIN